MGGFKEPRPVADLPQQETSEREDIASELSRGAFNASARVGGVALGT
jgi:hypothetical protein